MKIGPAMKRIDAALKSAADQRIADQRKMAEYEAKNKDLEERMRTRGGVGPVGSGDRFNIKSDDVVTEDGHVVIGLSEREKKRFSWGKCMKASVLGDPKIAEFEIECMKAASGLDENYRKKTAQFTNPTNMGWLVTPEFLSNIDLLRSALFMDKLPIQRYTGLRNSPMVKPRLTGEGSASWGPATENSAVTPSDGSMEQIQAFRHPYSASRDLSNVLLDEGPQTIDAIVRNGILNTAKRLVEKALIEGTGVSGQPIGMNNITGINTVAFTSATADEKQQKLRQMIWEILNDNVEANGMGWVVSPLVLSNLDRILQSTSSATSTANLASGTVLGMSAIPSLDGGPIKWMLGGIPVYTSTNITASTTSILTLAAWPEVSFYEWGSPIVKFTAEGRTNMLANQVTFALFASVDFTVDHVEAVCSGTAFTY